MNTTTTTAEWLGAGLIGICALALVAVAAVAGESHANASADLALAAYRDQRHSPDHTPGTPAPAPRAIPPCPAYTPDITVLTETVRLTPATAPRARHRKGSRWTL
ncbi:hypothetical protein ACW4TU_18685 [Streptomyces sp. QTS52]